MMIDMPETLLLVKTPFEKSLAQRINYACSILEIVSASQIYVPKREMDATDGLQKSLEAYSRVNTHYFNVFEKYFKAATERKSLIKGAGQSVKRTAQLINRCMISDLTIDHARRKQISALYRRIYAQNRLNAPYDFSRPSHNQDIQDYFHSNQVILDVFKEMVAQLDTYIFSGQKQQFSLPHCYLLISEMEMFNAEISLLTGKLNVLNTERLEIFDRIAERCEAICNRSRFIFGASSPTFKLIKRRRLSVR
ncbi:hypothetical protein [Dyadobacter sediminis]|jgi:chorismate mutase|nr:hypothetical protein [Dyadobacter sediminis]GGC06037.1 hypothetical protein GCM10011325_36150 [Dyadobacter sediminis]SKC20504.1 hypothetical protein SAMN05660293_05670 [Dyadobacter psychrophilus]